jgi:hypothetical protein
MGLGVGITAVAKEAKVSRWTMRRKVRELDRCFPELHLLAFTQGTKRPVGKYLVNSRALYECLSLVAAKSIHSEIVQRLDLHEGISRGLKIRIKRLERRMSRIDGLPRSGAK